MSAKLESTSTFLHRSDLGTRAKGYEDASLPHLLRHLEQVRSSSYSSDFPPHLEVNVWDEKGKGANPGLLQKFGGLFSVNREDVGYARQYARLALEGGALLAEVRLYLYLPSRDRMVLAYAESWRPAP